MTTTAILDEALTDSVSLLARQCPELGLTGTSLSRFAWHPGHACSGPRGTQATIAYHLNEEERARRREHGLTGVTRLDWLDLLMELPAGLLVPRSSLDPARQRNILRFPPGCVDLTPEGVIRRIEKPLTTRLALVTGQQWKAGLVRASRFAPYTNRALILPGVPRNLTQGAVEADFYGIGLIVNAAREPRLVVAPEICREYGHTPAGWAFVEAIYQQLDLEP